MSRPAASPRLLINPLSFRASRSGLAGRVAAAARQRGLEVLQATNPAELQQVLDGLRAAGTEQIWVLAGDGTLHAIAQYLAQPAAAGWSPAMLLLGGGRANVVPRDSGGYPAWPRFMAALQALGEGRALPEERLLTLRVDQEGAPPRHGFFLVAAVVYAGVRLCQEHRQQGEGWLHRSWFADPWCLLKIAAQVWAGRSPLPSYDDLQIRAEGELVLRAPMRLLIASTLQMRDTLYNPFATRGNGDVRLTAVAANARHFWRNLPAMFKGRFDDAMTVPQGYLSGRFAHTEVLGLDGYALDGELFAADPARPVRLSGGIALRVLRP